MSHPLGRTPFPGLVSRSSRSTSGFTLVELLVVITIIVLLAGMTMTVGPKVMERGRATSCLANLKQLGTGTRIYLNDNDDTMFSTTNPWPTALHDKAVSDWRAFRSPFDKPSTSRPADNNTPAPVSYGINAKALGKNTAKFDAPSQLILMAPAMDPGAEIAFSGTSTTSVTITPSGSANKPLGTHSNRNQINVVFADSHAQNLSYKEYADTSGDTGRLRWTPYEGR